MIRNHLLCVLFALSLSACVSPSTPPHPDFSGRWVIDKVNTQLQVPSLATLQNAVVVIEHRESTFKFQRTFTIAGSENTFSYELTTDGKEVVTQVPGQEQHSRLTWEGDQLVFSMRIVTPNDEAIDTVHYQLVKGGNVPQADESYRGAINASNHWVFNKE